MGQSIDCPIFQFISGKTGSLAFRRFSRVYSFRILAVSSHRLLFGSSGLPYCGKLAHPRYVALLHNRAMIPSFAPIERGLTMQSPFNWSEIDGITHIIFLPCSFAIRDIFLFAHYNFLQVRQVCRIAANLRTLALSLRSNAVYAPSFAPNSRKQRVIALFSAVWSERRDSNPQQPAWEAGILPLNYFRLACRYYITVPFILQ